MLLTKLQYVLITVITVLAMGYQLSLDLIVSDVGNRFRRTTF